MNNNMRQEALIVAQRYWMAINSVTQADQPAVTLSATVDRINATTQGDQAMGWSIRSPDDSMIEVNPDNTFRNFIAKEESILETEMTRKVAVSHEQAIRIASNLIPLLIGTPIELKLDHVSRQAAGVDDTQYGWLVSWSRVVNDLKVQPELFSVVVDSETGKIRYAARNIHPQSVFEPLTNILTSDQAQERARAEIKNKWNADVAWATHQEHLYLADIYNQAAL